MAKNINMKSPKVTVLMPVYNGEKYLHEAIKSILNQTFMDFEFIIIHDPSTDRTAEILQSYHDPRIKIINNEKNIGLTRSLNKGLKIARGEYIARMDADDVSIPERLEKEVNFLNQNRNIGLVGTYYLLINENGNVLHAVRPLTDDRELKEKLFIENQFGHGSVMFRRECIEKVGFYREEIEPAEDHDLWLRIAEFFEVANIPEFLYKWRLNFNSVSVARKKQQEKYALLAIELAKERKQFGKDRLQTRSRQEIDSFSDNLIQKPASQSRKEIAQSYYFWGTILLGGNDYRGALKLLLKSFISDPFGTWVLILEDLVLLLFPKSVVNILKFVKRSLHPRKQSSKKGEKE